MRARQPLDSSGEGLSILETGDSEGNEDDTRNAATLVGGSSEDPAATKPSATPLSANERDGDTLPTLSDIRKRFLEQDVGDDIEQPSTSRWSDDETEPPTKSLSSQASHSDPAQPTSGPESIDEPQSSVFAVFDDNEVYLCEPLLFENSRLNE